MYTKFKKVVLGLLGHLTPKIFFRRILRRTLKFTIHIVFRTVTNTVFFHAVASSVNEKPVTKIPQVTQAHYLCHLRVSYNMRTYGAKFRSGNVLENGNKNR